MSVSLFWSQVRRIITAAGAGCMSSRISGHNIRGVRMHGQPPSYTRTHVCTRRLRLILSEYSYIHGPILLTYKQTMAVAIVAIEALDTELTGFWCSLARRHILKASGRALCQCSFEYYCSRQKKILFLTGNSQKLFGLFLPIVTSVVCIRNFFIRYVI